MPAHRAVGLLPVLAGERDVSSLVGPTEVFDGAAWRDARSIPTRGDPSGVYARSRARPRRPSATGCSVLVGGTAFGVGPSTLAESLSPLS